MRKYLKNLKLPLTLLLIGILSFSPIDVKFVGAANTNSAIFDGSSDYLTATDGQELDQAGDVTVAAWVNFTSVPDNAEAIIVAKGTYAGGDSTSNYAITYCGATACGTGQIRANFRRSGDNNELTYNWTPTLDTWYFIAVSRTAADGDIDLHIQQAGDTSCTAVDNEAHTSGTDLVNNSIALNIGGTGAAGKYHDGLIDEVSIWRNVQDATAICSWFDVGLNGDETGLDAYYKLDSHLEDKGDGQDPTGTIGPDANDLTDSGGSITYSTDIPFGAATDSCTGTDGSTWAVDAADNCGISSNISHNGNLECFGSGSFVIQSGAEVSIYGNVNCPQLQVNSGGKFIIIPD